MPTRRDKEMSTPIVTDAIGEGVQLFRIKSPKLHFDEVTELPPKYDLYIGRCRVWKAKGEDSWYALLTIPYKDEEEILVRAPSAEWSEWDWKALADKADRCRWQGSSIDPRYVL